MHAVVVSFRIRPPFRAAFIEAVLANAAESLAREDGCHVFDVCEDGRTSEIVLYELYTDAAAFELHLRTPHFIAFDKASSGWVEEKQVRRLERLGVEG